MTTWRCLSCGTKFSEHQPLCTSCFTHGWVLPCGSRAFAAIDDEPEIVTARALARCEWQRVECLRYPELELGVGGFVLLSGPEGSGKSTMCAAMLDAIAGPVVLASVEEPPAPTLSARLLRANVKRADFTIVGRATIDQTVALLRKTMARAFAVDSIQPSGWSPADLRHILAVVEPLELVIATAQLNRAGTVAGVRALEHEVDVHIWVESLWWALEKSRYQDVNAGLRGPVLAPGAKSPEKESYATPFTD